MANPDWWANYFDAQYLLEFEPLFDLERDRHEVGRIMEVTGLPSGARVLDVPCGQGRHAHLLAGAGFDVDGLDYSRDLLARARARGTGRTLRYTRGDMRALPGRWSGRFDAVLNLFTSFGFFVDPADDGRLIREFARVLAPGGVLVWHGGNRDGVMARFVDRDWWQTSNGTLVAQERSFDPLTGQLTVHSVWSGKRHRGEREHRIRLYTPTRLAELITEAGLVLEAAFDGMRDRPLRRESSEMLLVARKPAPVRAASRPLPGRKRAR
ncbi:MAG TPA: class I SAM-dependent methyltransferase [Gemmatimonadaceae bacterium]|jgi:SAM-dependent methyltransferase|nr:class I SAM-dependent methyltransferase [Gemmatimonadaceae bacterium]